MVSYAAYLLAMWYYRQIYPDKEMLFESMSYRSWREMHPRGAMR